MFDRALDAGGTARWVTGGALHGQHHKLREALDDRGVLRFGGADESARHRHDNG